MTGRALETPEDAGHRRLRMLVENAGIDVGLYHPSGRLLCGSPALEAESPSLFERLAHRSLGRMLLEIVRTGVAWNGSALVRTRQGTVPRELRAVRAIDPVSNEPALVVTETDTALRRPASFPQASAEAILVAAATCGQHVVANGHVAGMQQALADIGRASGCEVVAVLRTEDEGRQALLWTAPGCTAPSPLRRAMVRQGDRAGEDPHPVVIEAQDSGVYLLGREVAVESCVLPLHDESGIYGLVIFERVEAVEPWAPGVLQALRSAAVALSTLVALVDRQTALVKLAVTDELTGVPNRRLLWSAIEREVDRATRYERPLTLALIDIDRFKTINDTYGHAFGDIVLRRIARRFRQEIRTTDLFARHGGEEFALLLPETGDVQAMHLLERVRLAIRETEVKRGRQKVTVTVSIGVAQWRPDRDGNDIDRLFARADAALYAAKAEGRDRVVLYDEWSVPTSKPSS